MLASYADKQGQLEFANVGSIGDVQRVCSRSNVIIAKSTDWDNLIWVFSKYRAAWLISSSGRKTTGFELSNHLTEHSLTDYTTANLRYTIGVNK